MSACDTRSIVVGLRDSPFGCQGTHARLNESPPDDNTFAYVRSTSCPPLVRLVKIA